MHYLLKDRVANVGEFVDAIARVAAGGTALDPEVVTGMLNATRHASALSALTARERDVLALMAEGRSNSAIADRLIVSERAVEKAHQQHLQQARTAALRLRPPAGPPRTRIPRIVTGSRTCQCGLQRPITAIRMAVGC